MGTPNQNRNILRKASANKFSNEASAWKRAILTQGGSITDAFLKTMDDKYFKPMVRNSLFSKFDRLCIYVGNDNEIAARTNTIKDAYHATKSGSPAFNRNQGYASASNGYLNLNYIPSTPGQQLTNTSNTVFIVVRNPGYTASYRSISARSSSPAARLGIYRDTTGVLAYNNSSSARTNFNKPTSGNVFMAAVLLSGTQSCYVGETTPATGSLTPVGLPSSSALELTEFTDGTSPSGSYDPAYHLCSGHGAGLTSSEIATLQTILNDLWTALGVQ